MGECGCGQVSIEEAYRIGRTRNVLGLQVFAGCDDCDYGPGIAVTLFPSAKAGREWLPEKIGHVVPDEYGSNSGCGISIGLFDRKDLAEAARQLVRDGWVADDSIGPRDNQYTLPDWLMEHGGMLMRRAIGIHEQRMERLREASEAAKEKP